MKEDLSSLTKEELLNLLNEERDLVNRYYNLEQSVKRILNSIYGAFGNQYFYFFNIDIAESITLQGQDVILYAEKMLNRYAKEFWHKDVKLHKKLGIKLKGEVTKPIVIYIDTDSVSSDSRVIVNNNEITIEEMFRNYSKINGFHLSQRGDEIIKNPDCKILNYSKEKDLYNANVSKIIRHKVKKKKWKLVTESGKEVNVTNDHSLIVLRNGKQIKITAEQINPKKDKVISIHKTKEYNFKEESIKSVECIGEFEDEYVYDIEVDDETHTFIANDILVHNSCYVSFQEFIEKSDWKGTEKDFILQIYEYRIKDYLEKIHQLYANNINGENFLSFELESIAKKGIWMAKKKYLQDIVWEDPDVHHDSLSRIKVKGFDTIQSSTPPFARKHLNEIIRIFFSQEKLNVKEVVQYLKKIKKEFKLANIEDITFSLRSNGYNKYIIDDQNVFEYASGCQYHIRGAGYHNYLLGKSNYKNKYQRIGNGDKVKVYYTKDKNCDSFAYSQGNYPYEFAPEVDYEMQFEKCILDPLNRIIKVIGLTQLDRNLLYTSSLF